MKAFVAIQYTDADGKHDVGDEVEFDLTKSDTDTKEGFERLFDYGILSKTPPKDEKADSTKQRQG